MFAHCVNGKLEIQSSELIEYVHDGYGLIYEMDIFLRFENGVVD